MKQEFTKYLENIGLSGVLIARCAALYKFCESVCPEEFVSIFVNDFVKEDGTREYESLWFFSKNFVLEAKGFIVRDEIDMLLYRGHIIYWLIEKQDYDFKDATEKSRMSVSVTFNEGQMNAVFKAAKNNCEFLRDVFHKHIRLDFAK